MVFGWDQKLVLVQHNIRCKVQILPAQAWQNASGQKRLHQAEALSIKPLNTAYNSSQVIFSKFYCAYDVLSGCIKIYQEPLVIMKDLPFSSLTRHVKTKLYVFSRVPNSEEKVTNPTSRTAEFSISGQSGFYAFIQHRSMGYHWYDNRSDTSLHVLDVTAQIETVPLIMIKHRPKPR